MLNSASTAAALEQMQRRRILVVGDVMLDRYVDGSVSRISPEAPVPVLDKARDTVMPGGAANVVFNLAALGCDVRLLSVSGDDAAGRQLASLLGGNMAVDFHQVIDTARPTTTKTRFRAEGQQVLRVDDEVVRPIEPALQDQIMASLENTLADTDLVILSDYAKGCLPPALIARVIKAANKAGKQVIADPKLTDFSIYSGSAVLTPNLTELRRAHPEAGNELEDIAKAASQLAKDAGISAILATLSARGMLLAEASGEWFHVPARSHEVFDVSGAGDTVAATLAAALAADVGMEPAVELANHAAGVVVCKSGTAVVSPGEIITATSPTPSTTDWDDAANACCEWQEGDQRVGFTNGCFDLLHPGHIYLLKAAAEQCDKLIVGINSDASVRRLKGETRPVQTAEQRAAAIQQLSFVDGVAIFDEDTPLELITAIQPDFIFKGGDYKADEVVGGTVVAARGGNVVIIPTHGSHSSSALIER